MLRVVDAASVAWSRCLPEIYRTVRVPTWKVGFRSYSFYVEDYHQQYLAKNPKEYCGLKGTGRVLPETPCGFRRTERVATEKMQRMDGWGAVGRFVVA